MCRLMGSHFHDWIHYNRVAFSIALLECGRTFSDFQGKAWFSLAHNHKHKDIRTRRMAYLTQFSIPALLNPMINKMADEASAILLFKCSHEVWVKVIYDWSKSALVLMLVLIYVDPVFIHSQSQDISISTRRTYLSVFLVLMLTLMSTQFSLAYTCACAYAYALVKSRIKTVLHIYGQQTYGNVVLYVKRKIFFIQCKVDTLIESD